MQWGELRVVMWFVVCGCVHLGFEGRFFFGGVDGGGGRVDGMLFIPGILERQHLQCQ